MSHRNMEEREILFLPTNEESDDISNLVEPPTLTPPKPRKTRTIIEPAVFLIFIASILSSKFSLIAVS